MAVSVCGAAGCLNSDAEPETPQPVDPENSPFKIPVQANRTSDFARPAQRLVVEFDLHRYTAPRGVFTANDSIIWKIVSGGLPTSKTTLHLADSGFRAAVGRESDRKPLADALADLRDKVDLRSDSDRLIPDVSRATHFGIGQLASPLITVFYQNGEGRVVGYDFRDARPRFFLTFGMRVDNLREIILRVVPAVEEPPGPPKWVGMQGGGFQQVQEERRRFFEELALTATIPEGGILVLGGTPIVYDRPYVGRAFFLDPPSGDVRDGATRESIYIICPVIRTVTDRLGVGTEPLEATTTEENRRTGGP